MLLVILETVKGKKKKKSAIRKLSSGKGKEMYFCVCTDNCSPSYNILHF